MTNRNCCKQIAEARIKGSNAYPKITGYVKFEQLQKGVLVTAQIHGLPFNADNCNPIYAFHIHSGNSCGGNNEDPFADAGGHYNPQNTQHPHHAGDLPPLFGNHGYAFLSVFTDRFTVSEIVGRVAIIHKNFDDFTSQPAGNAGAKIACGKILWKNRP